MQPIPKVSLVKTADGSLSLYHEELGVHYRSCFGADAEARYVFLEGCRLLEKTDRWVVLELGFGGGINFLHTAAAAHEAGCRLAYHSIEYAPLAPADLTALHQAMPPALQRGSRLALEAFEAAREPREAGSAITVCDDAITLSLYPMRWEDAPIPLDLEAHAIYHDPFAPRTNPEAWTPAIFSWMLPRLRADGILATYSAAAAVRAALAMAGFFVASAPGLGHKREITLASPSKEALSKYRLLSRELYLAKAKEIFS